MFLVEEWDAITDVFTSFIPFYVRTSYVSVAHVLDSFNEEINCFEYIFFNNLFPPYGRYVQRITLHSCVWNKLFLQLIRTEFISEYPTRVSLYGVVSCAITYLIRFVLFYLPTTRNHFNIFETSNLSNDLFSIIYSIRCIIFIKKSPLNITPIFTK